MSPSAWRVQYFSGAAPVIGPAAQGWQFAFPTQPNHVDYVTAPVAMNIAGKSIAATYNITGSNPLFDYHTANDNKCGPAAPGGGTIRLFFQQAGDDLSGAGQYEFYRWWSTADNVLKVGPGTISVALNPSLWTSVFGKNGTAAGAGWTNALANVANIGITFGGGCFAGHGVWLLGGSANFNMESFAVQ
jgi:hypothetical protein